MKNVKSMLHDASEIVPLDDFWHLFSNLFTPQRYMECVKQNSENTEDRCGFIGLLRVANKVESDEIFKSRHYNPGSHHNPYKTILHFSTMYLFRTNHSNEFISE